MNTVISLIFNELKLVPGQPFKYNNKSIKAYLSYLDDYDLDDDIDLNKILFKLDKELSVYYTDSEGAWSSGYEGMLKLILKEPSFIEPQILLAEEFEFLSKFDNVKYIVKQDDTLYITFEDFSKLIIPTVTLKFGFKFMQSGTVYHSKDLFKHKTGEY